MEWKPVEFFNHEGGDVRVPRKTRYESSSGIEDRLKRCKTSLWKTDEKRVAVVYSRGDKGMD